MKCGPKRKNLVRPRFSVCHGVRIRLCTKVVVYLYKVRFWRFQPGRVKG